MKIHDVEQGSVLWGQLRAGIPTASEFDQLVTPEFEIRKGQMPKTYLFRKLAEWWLGGPMLSVTTFDMDIGKLLEDEAKPTFELDFNVKISNVGFLTNDAGTVGCSPDGLIGDRAGIEIKCPDIHTQIGYLLNGELPKDYAAQVHGGMYVHENADVWHFYSYRRRLPNFALAVDRDEGKQRVLDEAVQMFLAKFESCKKKLIDLNGGPPQRNRFARPAQAEFVSELPT